MSLRTLDSEATLVSFLREAAVIAIILTAVFEAGHVSGSSASHFVMGIIFGALIAGIRRLV